MSDLPKIPPYTVPDSDKDLFGCGRVLTEGIITFTRLFNTHAYQIRDCGGSMQPVDPKVWARRRVGDRVRCPVCKGLFEYAGTLFDPTIPKHAKRKKWVISSGPGRGRKY